MSRLQQRRQFLQAAALAAFAPLAACGGGDDPPEPPPDAVSDKRIENAIGQLDAMAADLMAGSGLPGMAIAVVRDGKTIYAKGFGLRVATDPAPVDADTVFQLASVSKSVGATVVAREVGLNRIAWDTPIREQLPWFALSDSASTAAVTVGDLYAHRSGLPDHAGDRLEDLGYGQREVLTRLRYLPVPALGTRYAYTNFGLTAAAEAVATAAGMDWASLSEQAIYQPVGMTSTSSRYADFAARSNRALGHVRVDGKWVLSAGRKPDAQSPAGGVSSSVNDMAKWLAMVLAKGEFGGRRIVEAAALAPALRPQIQSSPPSGDHPAGHYGFGFNVGKTASGLETFSHSGAFELGAATAFTAVPALNLGIVTLTNGQPIGLPETLNAQFVDLVQFATIQRDWRTLYATAFASMTGPEGSLVGVPPPTSPLPARALHVYTGTYRNDYHGPIQVADRAGTLFISIGPVPLEIPLKHWDGDVFTFTLSGENASPGTISRAEFSSDRVRLEFYDQDGLGTFIR